MKLRNLLTNFWSFLLIAGIILAFFYPVWLKGKVPLPADLVVGSYFPWLDYDWGYPTGVPVKNPITSDAISFSFPMKMLAIDLMKDGQWPLWNQYILSGTPLLANFQSSPFSPTNFVYFLTDKLTGWSIQVILQHLIAAFGVYFLLRHWNASKIASIFGGIAFAFSGFNLIWSEWNSHTLSSAFIPFLILFTDKFFKGGKLWGICLSLVLAMQLYSGYPQIVFYSLIALGVLWLVNLETTKNFVVKTVFVFVYLLLGFGLAAPQIFPGYELLSLSQRESEIIPAQWAFLETKQVITFIAPDYFGNHATGNYWGSKNYTSNVGFVSATGLIFALAAAQFLKKSKEIKFLTLISLLSLMLSLPNSVSYFLWNSNMFGFQAGVSLRALALFVFSVSALAGLGLDRVLKSENKISVRNFLLVGLLIAIFFLWSLSFPDEDKWKSIIAQRNLVIPFVSFLVTLIAVKFLLIRKNFKFFTLSFIFSSLLLELFYFGWKFTPFSPRHIVYPETPVISFLRDQKEPFRANGGVTPTNLLIPYKIESPSGYDAVYPVNIAKFIAVLNSGDSGSSPQDRYGVVNNIDSKLFDLLDAKYMLVKNGVNISGSFQPVFSDKSVSVVENKENLGRRFVVWDWDVVKDDTQILDRLLDPSFPLGKRIILEEELSSLPSGFLFVAETWYPGWKAFVDGKEAKIYKADYAFRAVPVSGGNSNVEFVYEPESFYNGIKVSIISMLFLFLIYFFTRKARWLN